MAEEVCDMELAKSIMLPLMAAAAVSALMGIINESESYGGVNFITGLCIASYLLRILCGAVKAL